jgi:hypothetical protein
MSVSSTTAGRLKTLLYSRGFGLYGALGFRGNLQNRIEFNQVPLNDEEDKPVLVEAGWGHSAVVTEKGNLLVFGRPYDARNLLRLNSLYMLSNRLGRFVAKMSNSALFGNTEGYFPEPVLAVGGKDIKTLSCSAGFTLFTTKTGEVFSFGLNRWNQCGFPTNAFDATVFEPKAVPVPLCSKVETGFQHSLALTNDGQVIIWGKTSRGQLGQPKMKEQELSHLPTVVELEEKISDIGSGFAHCVAISETGKIFVWGKRMSEKLFSSPHDIQVAEDQWVPRIIELPNNLKAKEVYCSGFTNVFRANDNSLWIMGMNEKDLNANPFPVSITIDLAEKTNSNLDKFFNSIAFIKKGYNRVTVHCHHPSTLLDGTQHSNFQVVLSNGVGRLEPLSLIRTLEKDNLRIESNTIVDYSSGWKHDLLLVNTPI